MNLQLSGKRALVSGSPSGIGEAIARTLAREGVIVVVHGRNAERTQNFFSAVRLVQQLTPALRADGWGRIINIATGWAMQPATVMPHYAAAKAGLVNSTVSLAREFTDTGVTVNTVSPGPIRTPTLERTMRGIAQQSQWGTDDRAEIERRAVKEIVPNSVGRIGRVEDIANAVTFLASPLADYIDGANLRVDGGYVTSIN
jgi:3-oxoacyl-[acyl-carrier protein] reductase